MTPNQVPVKCNAPKWHGIVRYNLLFCVKGIGMEFWHVTIIVTSCAYEKYTNMMHVRRKTRYYRFDLSISLSFYVIHQSEGKIIKICNIKSQHYKNLTHIIDIAWLLHFSQIQWTQPLGMLQYLLHGVNMEIEQK